MFTRFQPQNIKLRAFYINFTHSALHRNTNNNKSAYAFCKYVGAKMIKEFENV